MKKTLLIGLPLLLIIGCLVTWLNETPLAIGWASNWKPVTLELKDGTVLKGEVRTRNSNPQLYAMLRRIFYKSNP